jgi:hypothetical protein
MLSNTAIIAETYNIIRNVASETVLLEAVKSAANKTEIIELNKKKKTCRLIEKTQSCNEYKLEYRPEDLTIFGGSAFALYYEKLGYNIQRAPSDIDIVWWPRFNNKNVIASSSSPAILELVKHFVDRLQVGFQNAEKLHKLISPYVQPDTAKIEVVYTKEMHFKICGTHNIEIYIVVNDIHYKLVDIIIHDTGCSQKYDIGGKHINTLKHMSDDPVYILDTEIISKNNIKIPVPNIPAFIKQQLFAYKNILGQVEEHNNKNGKQLINYAFKSYKRAEFLLDIYPYTENISHIIDSTRHILVKIKERYPYIKSIDILLKNTEKFSTISQFKKRVEDFQKQMNTSKHTSQTVTIKVPPSMIPKGHQKDAPIHYGYVVSKDGAVWTNNRWIYPNEVDKQTGAIWTGNYWFNPDSIQHKQATQFLLGKN